MTDQHFTMKKCRYILLQVSRLHIFLHQAVISPTLSLLMREMVLEGHNTLLNTVHEIYSKIQLTQISLFVLIETCLILIYEYKNNFHIGCTG